MNQGTEPSELIEDVLQHPKYAALLFFMFIVVLIIFPVISFVIIAVALPVSGVVFIIIIPVRLNALLKPG